MDRSNKNVVAAILVAGAMVAGAILLVRPKPPEPSKPDPFQEVKLAVASKMIDPGSATFQTLSEKASDFAYCGEVNSKNRMGGYVGYHKFYAQKGLSGEWIVTLDPGITAGMCK